MLVRASSSETAEGSGGQPASHVKMRRPTGEQLSVKARARGAGASCWAFLKRVRNHLIKTPRAAPPHVNIIKTPPPRPLPTPPRNGPRKPQSS